MSEPGQPNAAVFRLCFWEALKRLDDDERVHAMDIPCFDRSGADTLVDGYLPEEVWEHMEAAYNELRNVAGVGSS